MLGLEYIQENIHSVPEKYQNRAYVASVDPVVAWCMQNS